MNTLKSYRDLEVWQKSIELAELVYRLSAKFPAEERFGLTSQIRRAAASVAANIAEGAEREGTREFLQFLGIAGGSLAETEKGLNDGAIFQPSWNRFPSNLGRWLRLA